MASEGGVLDAPALEHLLRSSGVDTVAASAVMAAPASANAPSQRLLRPWREQVAELEQQALAAALQATGGNKAAAARMLGLSRATRYSRDPVKD